MRTLAVLLVKPSKYDDEGFVVRFWRGVLPSNTLAVLAGLTREVARSGRLGRTEIRTRLLDEQVQRIDPASLVRRHAGPETTVVAALCGVQSNQFPRAADLARQFRRAGAKVLLGGFHVSGSIATCTSGLPPECQQLIDDGVTLVKGEVEHCWGEILEDALEGRLRTLYDVEQPPALDDAPPPEIDRRLMRRFVSKSFGTVDTSRGCPFDCSFCTIINVQGRKMRCRSAESVIDLVRHNHRQGVDFYFFTDDNFARNPAWRGIFDGLIRLRAEEGISIEFMMQVDLPAARIPEFVEQAAAAGCTQVFLGMESVNPENLAASGKRQNNAAAYREWIDTWHAHGIVCHAGYIIGFPGDTPQSVERDVRILAEDVGIDQVSFFMMTPLPGSRDHAEMVRRGERIDEDFSRYDSDHAAMEHPRMSPSEWVEAYSDAWRSFYDTESMKRILSRALDRTYWDLFRNFTWYKYSFFVEGMHPMLAGLFRLKDRRQRRPGLAVESRLRHARRRLRELRAWTRGVVNLYFEMQEVWLATRGRPQLRENVDVLRERYGQVRESIGASAARAHRAISHQVAEARHAGQEMIHSADGRLRRLNPLRIKLRSREQLDAYWRETLEKLRRGRWLRINPVRASLNGLLDARIALAFNLSLLRAMTR